MKFRKNGRAAESNGNGSEKRGETGDKLVMVRFDPAKAAEAQSRRSDQGGNGTAKAKPASGTNREEADHADVGPAALKKFVSALTRELRERDEKIKALESQLSTEARGYEQKVAEAEARLAGEHDEKIARLEAAFERERSEMQVGIGSRLGVDVSSILEAAETAAEAVMSKAEAAAEQLRTEAEEFADRTHVQSEDAAEKLITEAETIANDVLTKARTEANAFHRKMRQVVGEVEQAYTSLGELAASLAQLGVEWNIEGAVEEARIEDVAVVIG